ncbi:MAG: amino acid permease [Enterococcus sp.]|nr:amino acid permease [Enterococcus sp.]
MKTVKQKKINSLNVGLMSFVVIFGFMNVINGLAFFDGLSVIPVWIIGIVLYFVPYSLICGELGSTFSEEKSGISAWAMRVSGPKLAFFAGWTFWAAQLPYISQKATKVLVAAGWVINQDNSLSLIDPVYIQFATLGIFLVSTYFATRGLNLIKTLSTFAGAAILGMTLLFIILVFFGVFAIPQNFQFSFQSSDINPFTNPSNFLNVSVIILALGGAETLSPYTSRMKNRSVYSKGIILCGILIVISAILGSLATVILLGGNKIPDDMATNGAYLAFQLLGQKIGCGNVLLALYAVCDTIAQFSVLVIFVDVPLRIFLGCARKKDRIIPEALLKQNKKGVFVNGQILQILIVAVLTLVPVSGIGNVDDMVKGVVKLTSICNPLGYLWVFIAYILYKERIRNFKPGTYVFIRNKKLACVVSAWCFALTIICSLVGMYDPDPFLMSLNVAVPISLIVICQIFPIIAKRKK